MTYIIRRDDLQDPRVIALIEKHQTHSYANSPETSVHTLDLAALKAPDLEVFVLWHGDTVLATGALKTMSPEAGEVKSMHVAQTARGQGLGRRMLVHLETQARALGMRRLWLETGAMQAYAPARALYERNGFTLCPPFGAYREDPNSVFMTKSLCP